MSFVIYDVETTGTHAQFDQILQFAAIRASTDLEIEEPFETRSRLLPHVVPAPGALLVNRLGIDDILDGGRRSHYEMMREIRETVGAWCPSTFLGYNSIRFDEEFLRHGFYQCLMPPYLTNTSGNTRADILSLMRACAALCPGVLRVPLGETGSPIFALHSLAKANGFSGDSAHEAMADVQAAHFLCKLVARDADGLWSRFLRYSQKASVLDFMSEQIAFLVFEPTAQRASFVVSRIGESIKRPNTHFCLNLASDIDALAILSPDGLVSHLGRAPETVRRVRANAAPMLCELLDAPATVLNAPPEDFVRSAQRLHDDIDFKQRLLAASEALLPTYPPSPHVEQQLYEQGFWSDDDRDTLARYHDAGWPERPKIAGGLKDGRLRRLAQRLAFVEQPELLTVSQRSRLAIDLRQRVAVESDPPVPWMTAPRAMVEIDRLVIEAGANDRAILLRYREHLTGLLSG
ncbi:MAG TPA: exonuclease domain-containing protein [Pirellulales bacterium]